MLLVPPCAPTLRLEGAIETLHPADCATDTVRPAIVRVPVRIGPSVGEMRKVTTAGPLPAFPLVMAIHAAWLSAVHAHPAGADTGICRSPPEASTLMVSVAIE